MKMVEVLVTDRDGRVVNRVAVNEDLFSEHLRRQRSDSTDLFTRWVLRMLFAIFEPVAVLGYNKFTVVDTGGTSRSQQMKLNITASMFFTTNNCNNRLWITYGTGTTPPTRNDYRLASIAGEGLAGVTLDEEDGTITISGSFMFTTSFTVYEVGLEWEGCVQSNNVCARILMDRTVFPGGVTIPAGGTLSVVYRFIT